MMVHACTVYAAADKNLAGCCSLLISDELEILTIKLSIVDANTSYDTQAGNWGNHVRCGAGVL